MKKTHNLEVSCGNCKTPVVLYEKAGKGNLIKMQLLRIIESEVNLEKHKGHLICPNCNTVLAKRGTYNNNRAYWTVRGRINTRRL